MHYPLVTLVGGAGFVGRHTVKLLASQGYRLRILVRDTVAAEFIKTAGNVGQIALEHADITKPETLAGKFAGSDAVVNFASILYQGGRQTFEAINVEGARAVAAEAKKAGAKALVHISGLGIEGAQETRYGQTKLAGEKAVREAFPDATILRPSLIVGPEDQFFQRFARMALLSPVLPLIGEGQTRFQPTLVTDVAQAVAYAINNGETKGKTYELGGPQIYTLREMFGMINTLTKRNTGFLRIPTPVARLMGTISEMLPIKPFITRDQVKMLKHDSVLGHTLGYAALGITPQSIESMLPHYLARYVKV